MLESTKKNHAILAHTLELSTIYSFMFCYNKNSFGNYEFIDLYFFWYGCKH